jgi:hypothetical protein
MTAMGLGMTMQVRNYEGTNLTEPLEIVDFQLEQEADRLADIFNMNPPIGLETPTFGKLHFSFAELEASRQIQEAAIHTPDGTTGLPMHNLEVKVDLGPGNWVLYQDAVLISIQNSFGDDGGRVDCSWRYRESIGRATPPRELQIHGLRRASKPVQKLDWKNLGF